MEGIVDIGPLGMALAYLLLLVPLAILFVERVPLLRESVVAVARMSIQLLFVGLYLQVVFRLDNAWLNLAWVGAMVAVADGSVLRGCRLGCGALRCPCSWPCWREPCCRWACWWPGCCGGAAAWKPST